MVDQTRYRFATTVTEVTSPSNPLDPDEERLWRALLRVTVALPRVLDVDLDRTGLSLTEYGVLMNLSEADEHEMRMSDLAAATNLSASRMTRVVNDLQSERLVTRRRCPEDGRGHIAQLTAAGMARLKSAYPAHLASARRRVVNHLDPRLTRRMATILTQIGEELDSANPDQIH